MLLRSDPFREFDRLAQSALANRARPASMPIDAYRRGDDMFVHIDVPGVDPASIDVTVEKNVLTVTAERRWVLSEEDKIVTSERTQGTFSRQFFFGDGLNLDALQANYEHGVLTVVIPVAAQAKPRKVEVSTTSTAPQAIEAAEAA